MDPKYLFVVLLVAVGCLANLAANESGSDLDLVWEQKSPDLHDFAKKQLDDEENPDEREGSPEKSKDGKDDGRVKTSVFTFQGKVKKYVYLENSNVPDETVLVLTNRNQVYVSHDQGLVWEQVAPDDEFLDIYLDPYDSSNVYLLAVNDKIVYSHDRADNWKSFRTPSKAVPGISALYFHPENKKRLIFMGQDGCNVPFSKACRTAAYHTVSAGKRWLKIQDNVDKCQFSDKDWILCEKSSNEATGFRPSLVASRDLFKDQTRTLLENLVDLAHVQGYWVATTQMPHDELKAHVSMDGLDWATARLPANVQVNKQQAFTVLSGASGAVFLHVTTNAQSGTEYGSIFKSNSAGTSYVLNLENSNRDEGGFVDFEQIQGLEGLVVANVVDNPQDARKGARKRIKSLITHNDGAHWAPIQPPAIDVDNQRYCSGQSLEQCSLHLHGYTEQADYRDTFSSSSAVGMMIGVGNVGSELESYYDGNTYLTKDGGVSWKEVKKGVYLWEYGDQGSVIVMVNGKDNTNVLSYSVDEGDTWQEYKFTDEQITVEDISTVPGDNSLVFLLFTRVPLARGDKTRVFRIDFGELLSDSCSGTDLETWIPKHPFQADDCLFGHQMQYTRKIPGRLCRIGSQKLDQAAIIKTCQCTRQDFECDFNYYQDQNGDCKLVSGVKLPGHEDMCAIEESGEYYPVTGYRKVPLSTCEGGLQLDRSDKPVSCDAAEEDHLRSEFGRLLWFWLKIVIVGSLVVAVVFKYLQLRHGEIRLDDEETIDISKWTALKTTVLDWTVSLQQAAKDCVFKRVPLTTSVSDEDEDDFTDQV